MTKPIYNVLKLYEPSKNGHTFLDMSHCGAVPVYDKKPPLELTEKWIKRHLVGIAYTTRNENTRLATTSVKGVKALRPHVFGTLMPDGICHHCHLVAVYIAATPGWK